MRHYASPEDYSLRRKRANDVHQGQRQVVCFERPDAVIERQGIGRLSPACGHCRSGRQALETISEFERLAAAERLNPREAYEEMGLYPDPEPWSDAALGWK